MRKEVSLLRERGARLLRLCFCENHTQDFDGRKSNKITRLNSGLLCNGQQLALLTWLTQQQQRGSQERMLLSIINREI